MNDGRYNEQYNKMYNEQNTKLNLGPNREVYNEANIDPVDHVENTDEDPVQIQRSGRHVEGVSCTGADMSGTSEVRNNVSVDDSDNTPNDLKRLVGLFAMRRNFEWKVKRSNKRTLHLVCLIDNYTWKLRAVMRDGGTYFQVRSFVNEHSCPLEEIHRRHRQASAVIIGEVVAPILQQQNGRLMRPKDIIADMKTMHGIQIMCSKAHQALHYALSLTYGTHEETVQLLPSFGYVLEQQNPNTITYLQCANDSKFLFFFISLGASVRGFRRCMPPVIAVDGTPLKGRFRGTMFIATAQDANEQVYPIAFGYMCELSNLHKNVFDYVEAAGPHKWSRVHCSQRRYRVMTTNVAECINSCLKFARQLPMLTLAEFIRNMLQRWFHDRHRAAQSMRHQLTYASYLVMLKRVEKEQNLDLTSLCADYYKRQTLIDAYSIPIMPVGYPFSRVMPSDIAERVVLNPKTKRQSGHPMEGRHASSSERTTTQSCRRCGQLGHNSRRCSNLPLINEGPSIIVPEEYRRKSSVCHQVGHNKQMCPNRESTVE
ncbi:hypothetical protein Dsin_024379 [Dipteronia sinensis]|uniref:CCHC-type domain-containing protein n=1 Tax=Dipteronia sinensis TaxID=43782 RepID=A0AAE0DXC3_9ROSI|nr:hypothetical protein Dsin_024379 [Dipteronia sinensis]